MQSKASISPEHVPSIEIVHQDKSDDSFVKESDESIKETTDDDLNDQDFLPEIIYEEGVEKIKAPDFLIKEFEKTNVGYRQVSTILAACLIWADKCPNMYAISPSYLNSECLKLRERIKEENEEHIQKLTTKISVMHDGKQTKQIAAHHLPREFPMTSLAYTNGEAIPLTTEVLEKKSGKAIAECLYKQINERDLSPNTVAAVSDGENLNKGIRGGVTTHLENLLQKPLLQII